MLLGRIAISSRIGEPAARCSPTVAGELGTLWNQQASSQLHSRWAVIQACTAIGCTSSPLLSIIGTNKISYICDRIPTNSTSGIAPGDTWSDNQLKSFSCANSFDVPALCRTARCSGTAGPIGCLQTQWFTCCHMLLCDGLHLCRALSSSAVSEGFGLDASRRIRNGLA